MNQPDHTPQLLTAQEVAFLGDISERVRVFYTLTLPEKVIFLRKQGKTFDEIGEILGFSKQRVNQILKKKAKREGNNHA